jgi:GNAT superfamily N-acetyltransferase
MIDMLARLYDLPDGREARARLAAAGCLLRRPGAYEKHLVCGWVGATFSPKWRSECEVAFARQPVACFIATRASQVLGFACYETTARGFFGPMGVAESERGSGLGKALLLLALEAMRELGYAYAVIGGVGPREFYERAVGAVEIPGSSPGIYRDILPG